jgi:hypothetical protein
VSLSIKQVFGRRPFISLPYTPDDHGRLRPGKVALCPAAMADSPDVTCRIQIERWRHRIHGPGFLLCGMRCCNHCISFSVYPPGWTPYGRKSLAPVDHLGRIIVAEMEASPWRETLFDAVFDAAAGVFWSEEVNSLGPSVPESATSATVHCRQTQRRHIKGAMRLFGLDVASTTRDRETVSRELRLNLAILHEGSVRIRDGPTMAAWGREGARVLSELPAMNSSISGLLVLGEGRGLWGPMLHRRSLEKPARSVDSSAKGGSGIRLPTLTGGAKDAKQRPR